MKLETKLREDGETLAFIAQAPGRAVPRPDGQPWRVIDGKPVGDWIVLDQYVRRRLADADLVAADPTAAERAWAAEEKRREAERREAERLAQEAADAAAEGTTSAAPTAETAKKKG